MNSDERLRIIKIYGLLQAGEIELKTVKVDYKKLEKENNILKMNIRMLKEEIKILKANNDHICTGELPY